METHPLANGPCSGLANNHDPSDPHIWKKIFAFAKKLDMKNCDTLRW